MEFMLDEKDLLVLDEPTNHLDLPSREQLERTLATFPGTILLVTHDRYFLEKLTDKLLVIENKTIKRIEQSYSDWVNRINETSKEQELLRLETERQAVLGELTYLDKKHPRYEVLNQQFTHLTKLINQIKR
jgi:macrolide transport system ATP-binding/permease protein